MSVFGRVNARWWHLAGDGWISEPFIQIGVCDDDWGCWSNPWPWGGVVTTS